MIKKYFYKLLARYLSLYIRPDNTVLEVNPVSAKLADHFTQVKTLLYRRVLENTFEFTSEKEQAHYQHRKGQLPASNVYDGSASLVADNTESAASAPYPPDYILLNGNIHYEQDIQSFLDGLHQIHGTATRLIIIYYNGLWRPLMRLATSLGLREKTPELNWVAPEDVENFLRLTDYEIVRRESKVLLPIYIPLLSTLLNRYVAPLPFFRLFAMVNITVAKPIGNVAMKQKPSVSIIVPARNEAGNIENIIRRIPKMGVDDEIILVEGNSTDNTWQVIEQMYEKYRHDKNIVIARQEGRGKADAVRKGFAIASKDILMILDADLTVPAEDLPKFYRAIAYGKGEFINGSRLVYPMEKEAMRFFNILGNKFFALGFSFVLGQRFKDTLCGTKVLSRENYLKLAANRKYFGDFDPFGDFDLLFGAARMCLKIVEVPIAYKERTYGSTNIQRWKHGAILLRMLFFAAGKFKFI